MAVESSRMRATYRVAQLDRSPFGESVAQVVARFRTHLGFSAAAAAIWYGYEGRMERELTASHGIGYALGYIAVACMLLLLLFPLRKRFTILKFLGATKSWFRNHIVLGVASPIIALYHCNFLPGSFNGRIALYSAVTVAASGIVGRFIYTKVFRRLNDRKASLKELRKRIQDSVPGNGSALLFLPDLLVRLTEFDDSVLSPPSGVRDSLALPLRLMVATRLERWRLIRFARRRIMLESIYSPVIAANRRKLEKTTARYIARHLREVRRVAEFTAYQRLFALWHKIHLPFFVLLVVTVSIHIFAVHWY